MIIISKKKINFNRLTMIIVEHRTSIQSCDWLKLLISIVVSITVTTLDPKVTPYNYGVISLSIVRLKIN